MARTLLLSVCLLLTFPYAGYSQKAEIYGKWYFDRFGGPHGETSKDGEIAKANKQNEGYSFNFTHENTMIVTQATGSARKVPYELFPGRIIIINQVDTMRIMLLTADILELYPASDTKPALFLKRTKDGKTSMSAQ
jgi:hypothetical protein